MTQPENNISQKAKIDDGGAAFPLMPPIDMVQGNGQGSAPGYPYPSAGMTLRDYFAAKALSGVLATDAHWAAQGDKCDTVARWAYNLADAMLKARA